MFLSFQGATIGKICCFTSVKNSDGKRDKSGVNMFWHNAWFLLLNCTFFCPVINLLRFCQFLSFCVKKKNAVCSCWVETSIFSAQFPRILFSLVLLKPRRWLGGHCPLGTAHSLRDAQPRQLCLSWVFRARLLLDAGAEMTQRPEEGEREEWGSWEGWRLVLEEKRILAAQMDWGWARGKTSLRRKAPWRTDVTNWRGTASPEFGREGASWRGRTWVMGEAARCSERPRERGEGGGGSSSSSRSGVRRGVGRQEQGRAGRQAAGSAGTPASFSRRDAGQVWAVCVSLDHCWSLVPGDNRY